MSASPQRGAAVCAAVTVALSTALLTGCDSASPPEPSASASATQAAATESPSPTAIAFDLVTGDDADILARLESPTTGETWHDPILIDNLGYFAYPDYGIEDDHLYYEVGAHGSATLVVAVDPYFDNYMPGQIVYALLEVEAGGARMITCPSARATDACTEWSSDWEAPGRVLDTTTHYDSLTYPTLIQPEHGWFLEPSVLANTSYKANGSDAFGEASEFTGIGLDEYALWQLGRAHAREITPLGQSSLVEYSAPGDVEGTVAVRYAIITPFGSVIMSRSSFPAASYGQDMVIWDDGADTFTGDTWDGTDTMSYPVRSASYVCSGADEVLIKSFVESEWVAAGVHSTGAVVYLPAPGGNDLAEATFTTMRDASWGGVIDTVNLDYPYTYEQFLAERSVFAWQRGDGAWVLGMSGEASNRVYECS